MKKFLFLMVAIIMANAVSAMTYDVDSYYLDNKNEEISHLDFNSKSDTIKLLRNLYVIKKNGLCGLYKKEKKGNFKEELPCEYDSIVKKTFEVVFRAANGNGSVKNYTYYYLYKNGLIGGINHRDVFYEMIPCEYEELEFLEIYNYGGFVMGAKKNGKYGIIYDDNSVKFDFCLDKMPKKVYEGYLMEIDGKTGIMDISSGETVIPLIYEISEPSDGMIRVKKNDTYSYVTEDFMFGSNCNRYRKEGKDEFIGEYFYFSDAKDFHEGVAAVKYGNSWGYTSKEFSWVIMPKFDEAGDFIDGKALVRKGNKEYYIGKDGKKIKK